MNLPRRLDRAENLLPPPSPPSGSALEEVVPFLTLVELKLGRNEFRQGKFDSSIMMTLKARALSRQRHFGFSLWQAVSGTIQVPEAWSLAAEWGCLRNAAEMAWRRKGEAVDRPLFLETTGVTPADLTVVAALLDRGHWRGAPVASWNTAVYLGELDDIAAAIGHVKLNGAPMTLGAIGLSENTYPRKIRDDWEKRGGRSDLWRALLKPLPDFDQI